MTVLENSLIIAAFLSERDPAHFATFAVPRAFDGGRRAWK